METAIMAGCFLAGGLAGVLLGRARAWRLLWAIAAGLAIAVGWQWMQAQDAASGWDGIAIMLLVFLFLMPGLIGLLGGGWLAWWQARRAAGKDAGGGA